MQFRERGLHSGKTAYGKHWRYTPYLVCVCVSKYVSKYDQNLHFEKKIDRDLKLRFLEVWEKPDENYGNTYNLISSEWVVEVVMKNRILIRGKSSKFRVYVGELDC